MIEEDLFEQEIQKKKRRVLVLLICLFVLAGGGFVARKNSLAETESTATPIRVAESGVQPAPVETPEGNRPDVSEENGIQTPVVEKAITEAGEVGGAIDVGGGTPEAGATKEEGSDEGTAINDDGPVVDDVESETASSDVDVDKPIVDDEDDGDSQTGGGKDTNLGDGVASAETGIIIGKESTADPDSTTTDTEADMDDLNSDNDQSHDGSGGDTDLDAGIPNSAGESEDSEQIGDGVPPADELVDENQLEDELDADDMSTADESDSELSTDEERGIEQDADAEQMTDFQPPPGQLPITGSAGIDWSVAPIVAISLVILLVGAGTLALFPRHRRY